VQAALAGRYGLRDFFAVTTEWRPYWDSLPADPLASCDDPALPHAQRGMARADRAPYAAVLADALERTATIADLVRDLSPVDSLFRTTRVRHPSGFLVAAELATDPSARCGSCAWSFGLGKSRLGCRQAKRLGRDHAALFAETPACERFEPRLSDDSCGPCGACCRQGFDRVDVRPRDVIKKRHPELVHEDAWGTHLPRPGGLCVALEVRSGEHRCRVYGDRPRSCSEFAVGGDACLEARRRVGLSR
jgi:hypothetical protein